MDIKKFKITKLLISDELDVTMEGYLGRSRKIYFLNTEQVEEIQQQQAEQTKTPRHILQIAELIEEKKLNVIYKKNTRPLLIIFMYKHIYFFY